MTVSRIQRIRNLRGAYSRTAVTLESTCEASYGHRAAAGVLRKWARFLSCSPLEGN
jgi:hypothetical protein